MTSKGPAGRWGSFFLERFAFKKEAAFNVMKAACYVRSWNFSKVVVLQFPASRRTLRLRSGQAGSRLLYNPCNNR